MINKKYASLQSDNDEMGMAITVITMIVVIAAITTIVIISMIVTHHHFRNYCTGIGEIFGYDGGKPVYINKSLCGNNNDSILPIILWFRCMAYSIVI